MLLGGEGPAGKDWTGRQSSWPGANDLPLPPRPFRQSGGRVAAVYDRRKGSRDIGDGKYVKDVKCTNEASKLLKTITRLLKTNPKRTQKVANS